jgi:hypothetical protein
MRDNVILQERSLRVEITWGERRRGRRPGRCCAGSSNSFRAPRRPSAPICGSCIVAAPAAFILPLIAGSPIDFDHLNLDSDAALKLTSRHLQKTILGQPS